MPGGTALRPLDATLVRVVLLMRALGWAWLMVLGVVTLVTRPNAEAPLVIGAMVVATAGTVVTMLAGRRGFLANPIYVAADGVLTIALALVGPLADVGDFIAGGYPASWLFIVAYASNTRVAAVVGAGAAALFAVMHVVLGLGATRAYGSIQFLVIAVVVGWGFDALRRQERLRLTAQEELSNEQARAARLEERSQIAVRLHDSVLQTLKLIRASSDNAPEVRYLARAQERDLRRTISDYESPYEQSFRARLLDAQGDIEDMYRVEVDQVIKDDAEMDGHLDVLVAVTRDVMSLAVSEDGARKIDLFTEMSGRLARTNIRTAPTSGSATVVSDHLVTRLDDVGGTFSVRNAPGASREVVVTVTR